MNKLIKPYVITGGPCGGKSSIIPLLIETLSERGYTVYPIPEVATYLESIGKHPKHGMRVDDFQDLIIETQTQREAEAQQASSKDSQSRHIILNDRGLIDNIAYVSSYDTYKEILNQHGLNIEEVLNDRYAGAIGLQTAAYGAEEFYTTANNTARSETPQEARDRENKIIQAYGRSHINWRFIANINPQTGVKYTFDQKKSHAENALFSLIGEPPIEYERQFEVYDFDEAILQSYQPLQFEIEQHYIPMEEFGRPDFDEARVRQMRNIQNGKVYYFLTLKKDIGGQRIEEEKEIDKDHFHTLQQDSFKSVYKTRYKFINPLDNHRYEFDCFKTDTNLYTGKQRLEVELTGPEVGFKIPIFIKRYQETTGNSQYSNFNRG